MTEPTIDTSNETPEAAAAREAITKAAQDENAAEQLARALFRDAQKAIVDRGIAKHANAWMAKGLKAMLAAVEPVRLNATMMVVSGMPYVYQEIEFLNEMHRLVTSRLNAIYKQMEAARTDSAKLFGSQGFTPFPSNEWTAKVAVIEKGCAIALSNALAQLEVRRDEALFISERVRELEAAQGQEEPVLDPDRFIVREVTFAPMMEDSRHASVASAQKRIAAMDDGGNGNWDIFDSVTGRVVG